MTITAPHHLGVFARLFPFARRAKRTSTRADSPVETFIAEYVYAAPGRRLAITVIIRAWHRHADALGIDHGTNADLIAVVRRAYPEVRRVRARSGRDVHRGGHLTGITMQ